MTQKINPYLLLVGGLASMFLSASLFVTFGIPNLLLQYQPIVVPVIFLSFFVATCAFNMYIQLGAWVIMTLVSGLRFAVFFLAIAQVENIVEATNFPLLTGGLILWAIFMAWKILAGLRRPRLDELRIAVVAILQVTIAVLAQSAIFSVR